MVETRSQKIAKEKAEMVKTETVKQSEEKEQVTSTPAANDDENDDRPVRTPKRAIFGSLILLLITYFTLPDTLQPVGKPTIQHVWYFGWISAISTGLGVIPLIFAPDFDTYYVGISNGKIYSSFALFCTFTNRHWNLIFHHSLYFLFCL